VYPEAKDIAVPPFPPDTVWAGGEPKAVERLCAQGPVLVHFICAGDLGSVRTLPYLQDWHDRYAAHSLSVLGVNTPRFAYTADPGKLSAALSRLGVTFPVALDANRTIWRDYGSYGWPSLFLWGLGGALRWYHFGEGEYAATEEAIQELLREVDALASLPAPLAPLRPSDVAGAAVVPPSEEIFPGGSAGKPLRGDDGVLKVAYSAGGVAVSVDGVGELGVSVDGSSEGSVNVSAPGVYELANHERHGRHELALRVGRGVDLYAVSFAPGVP
jgi:hypothetical protein